MTESGAAFVQLTESSPGVFTASGVLTFATARRARQSGLAAFGTTAARAIKVDCGGITAADSAGMTVLLDWLAIARKSGRSLGFGNLPEQVRAIARISDALELLERGV